MYLHHNTDRVSHVVVRDVASVMQALHLVAEGHPVALLLPEQVAAVRDLTGLPPRPVPIESRSRAAALLSQANRGGPLELEIAAELLGVAVWPLSMTA